MTRGYEPGRAITPRIFSALAAPFGVPCICGKARHGCQFLGAYRTINWKRDVCYLILSDPLGTTLLTPAPLLLPVRPRFRPHSRAKHVRTRRSRYSRYVPARNSFHLADKASLPHPISIGPGVNFSRARPRKYGGGGGEGDPRRRAESRRQD